MFINEKHNWICIYSIICNFIAGVIPDNVINDVKIFAENVKNVKNGWKLVKIEVFLRFKQRKTRNNQNDIYII